MQFAQIPGHIDLKEKLTENVRNQRIPHAQLFLGTDGACVLPMALAYTQYLFCKNRTQADACGSCENCNKVSKFNHPDVHFSFPFKNSTKTPTSTAFAKSWRAQLQETPFFDLSTWGDQIELGNSQPIIPVKEADEISGKLALKSFEGGLKVLIMWHAEMLNMQAANKLLKLIEEPPAGTVILLISDQFDQLLKTITSRTQLVKINRITNEELLRHLTEVENVDQGRALSIVNIAEGSYLSVIRQLNSDQSEAANFQYFQEWMRICYQKKVLDAFDWSDRMAGIGRENQKQFLAFCLQMARQCILGNYTDMKMVSLQGPERDFLTKFARFINHRNVLELTEEFSRAHYHIGRNANAKILFTDLSIKVIKLLRK